MNCLWKCTQEVKGACAAELWEMLGCSKGLYLGINIRAKAQNHTTPPVEYTLMTRGGKWSSVVSFVFLL